MKTYAIRDGPWGTRDLESVEAARGRFRKVLTNPDSWFASARQLIFAMHLLEPSVAQFWAALATQGTAAEEPIPDTECLQVHVMLAGLAIENLCKGYLVTCLLPEEKAKLEEGQLPKRLDQQHKIRRLVSETGLKTSDVENELLTRVEDSVRWLVATLRQNPPR